MYLYWKSAPFPCDQLFIFCILPKVNRMPFVCLFGISKLSFKIISFGKKHRPNCQFSYSMSSPDNFNKKLMLAGSSTEVLALIQSVQMFF